MNNLLILGTRGVPARHGGFETFAERLALFLKRENWNVSVYCQEDGDTNAKLREEDWQGIRRIVVPVPRLGPLSSVIFDFRCLIDAAQRPGTLLILGYNTAIFAFLPRLWSRSKAINMDGLEWKRAKWPLLVKAWLWFNERLATRTGALLIADNPEIENRLRRIAPRAQTVMIPYGADRITTSPASILDSYGLQPDNYFLVISRIEPENSILEMVQAFSSKPRQRKLVIIGNLDVENSAYHRAVRQASNDSVVFLGAIYDGDTIKSLRFHAWVYCHGHTVGGTNPSLVEALGAGNAVILHDNPFNRWTAGIDQFYFNHRQDCAVLFDALDGVAGAVSREKARAAAVVRFESGLTWDDVLENYRAVLAKLDVAQASVAPVEQTAKQTAELPTTSAGIRRDP
jgi:glycosyltransferase involved in cell wall biosynthesis